MSVLNAVGPCLEPGNRLTVDYDVGDLSELTMHQAETDHEASDTDEDESSTPRADSSSADEGDEEVFYEASDLSRSNSLQASRSLSLPAFEGDSAFDNARYMLLRISGIQIVHIGHLPKHR